MSKMNCNEFESAHRQAIESRSAQLTESLHAHAAECDACASSVAEDAVLERTLSAWLNAVPRVDLTDVVLARWRSEQPALPVAPVVAAKTPKLVSSQSDTTAGRSSARGVGLMLVALICLLAFVRLISTTTVPIERNALNGSPTVAAQDSQPKSAIPEGAEPVPEIDGLVRNMGSAYLGLAYDVGNTLSDAAEIIPSVGFRPEVGTADGDKTLLPAAAPSGEWTNEFKPIGQKVGKAFGFLLEAIPTNGFTST